jgi:hypothetical protein
MRDINWLNLPGTASTLIPNSGIAQACRTSADVIKIRSPILQGSTSGLSTSNNLRSPIFKLSVIIIQLSNSKLLNRAGSSKLNSVKNVFGEFL